MKTTSVRVDVPDSLYEILVSDQEKRRQSSGKKKPSLSSIILEYCGKNNKYVPADQYNDQYEQRVVHPEQINVHPEQNHVRHEQKKIQHHQKNIQNNVQLEQNNTVIPNSSLPETGIEKRLKQWEEHLSRWEASLREKEAMLKEKEEDIFEQKEDVYQMKIDLLEQKDNYRQETLAGPEKIIESRMLSYDLEHKNKKISELEERLRDAELKYHKAQKLEIPRKLVP
jgi:chromosome segregation ATPase